MSLNSFINYNYQTTLNSLLSVLWCYVSRTTIHYHRLFALGLSCHDIVWRRLDHFPLPAIKIIKISLPGSLVPHIVSMFPRSRHITNLINCRSSLSSPSHVNQQNWVPYQFHSSSLRWLIFDCEVGVRVILVDASGLSMHVTDGCLSMRCL